MTMEQTAVLAHEMELTLLIEKMDLPVYKRDVTKPLIVRWLLQNLGVRNSGHQHYTRSRQILLDLARHHSVIKESEARRIEQELACGVSTELHPHQHNALTKLKNGGIQSGSMFVTAAGRGKSQVDAQTLKIQALKIRPDPKTMHFTYDVGSSRIADATSNGDDK